MYYLANFKNHLSFRVFTETVLLRLFYNCSLVQLVQIKEKRSECCLLFLVRFVFTLMRSRGLRSISFSDVIMDSWANPDLVTPAGHAAHYEPGVTTSSQRNYS